MDMKNSARDEHVRKKVMAKVLEDTNQGTSTQGDSCDFPFHGNIGAPLMATLNILGLNVGLPVWLCTTLKLPDALDASQISTLCQGHRTNVDSSPSTSTKSTSPPIGDMSPTYASHAGGKKLSAASHDGSMSPVTSSHTSISSPTSVSHFGDRSTTPVSHAEDQHPTSASHAGGRNLVNDSHTGIESPTSTSYVGVLSLTFASHSGDVQPTSTNHVEGNPPANASHVRGIGTGENPRHIGCNPKFPCKL
jgi:hypothetical protein